MKKMIIAALGMVMLASCKKENVNPAPVPAETKNLMKMTSVYDNGTPETITYTYDANGRVATLKKNERTETFDFVSAVSLVVTQRSNSDNSVLSIRECTLNDKGYITKIVVKNAIGVLAGTYDYIYNADGYLTGQKLTYPSGSTMEQVYEIVDGNTVSVKLYYDNILNSTRTISYDNAKINKTQLSFYSYWDNVSRLFGKPTKNMALESKSFNPSGTLTYHIQLSFDLDATGYPTRLVLNYPLLGKQGVDTYTYQ